MTDTLSPTLRMSGPLGMALSAIAGFIVALLGAVGFKQLAINEPQIAVALFSLIAGTVIGLLGFLQVAKSRLGAAALFAMCFVFIAIGVVFAWPYRGQVIVHLMATPKNLAVEHVPPAFATFGSRQPGFDVDWSAGATGGVKDSEAIAIDVSSLVQFYTDELNARASGGATALANCQSTPRTANGGGI